MIKTKLVLLGIGLLGFWGLMGTQAPIATADSGTVNILDQFSGGLNSAGAAINSVGGLVDQIQNFGGGSSNSGGGTGSVKSVNYEEGLINVPDVDNLYISPGTPIFYGPGLEVGAKLTASNLDENISKERDLKKLIIGWINFLLSFAAILAVVAIVWAGTLYITALGEDGQQEKAKKIILWSVIGLLVILGAYAIVNTIITLDSGL
jgi:hypothetical protein